MLIPRLYAAIWLSFFWVGKMCMFIYVCICLGVSSNGYVTLKSGEREELKSILGWSRISEDSVSYWGTSQTTWWATSAFPLSVSDPYRSRKWHNSPRATWIETWVPTAAQSISDRALLLILQCAGCYLLPGNEENCVFCGDFCTSSVMSSRVSPCFPLADKLLSPVASIAQNEHV